MYDILLIIQYINIVGIFAECIIIFRRWKNNLHGWLFLNCIVQLVNAAGILAEYTSYSEAGYVTALRLSYLGRTWVALFMFMFVAELCAIRLPQVLKLCLILVHAGIYLTVYLIPDCNLYYTDYVFYSEGGFAHFSHTNGITHHLYTVLQISYIIAGFVMIFISMRKEKNSTAKKRLIMVRLAIASMTVFYIVQISGLFGTLTRVFDVTVLGYTICNTFLYIAILRFDLLGMREAARDVMIDRLAECIIAVDNNGSVQYYNTPAKELYPGLTLSSSGVPEEIPAAIAAGGIMNINDRIYKAEESELMQGGERFGTLYALVDETEHYRYMEALEKQKALADSANNAKSAFLANMSHDIRTPINAVLGMNEMVLRECDDENIIGYSENIRTAGNTLLALINDILDFSKIEAGKLDIIPVEYDLAAMLNDLVNMIQARAEAKGLALDLEIDRNTPRLLRGDEIRIKQIITNLLTNAVKYTEHGSVTFSVGFERLPEDEHAAALNVSIADTGIGIKPEDMPKLFSEFDRIEEVRNRSIEGTGLGMSITRRLLGMMDSRLDVESEYGKGSVFSFTLRQEVVKWDPVGNYEEAFRHSLSERRKYRESFTAPEARVLVIDDTPMNLTVFRSLLKATLIQITTAETGDEGIALAKETKYDIIFIDHMMPNKDGIETLAEIKAGGGLNSDTVTICLTANAISGAREQYLAAGFDDYLTKPIDPKRLEQTIIDYLPEDRVVIAQDGEPAAEEIREPGAETALPELLYETGEIDTKNGLMHCGTADIYLDSLSIYAQCVETNASEIERFLAAGDLKNATIKIHALKSTSRVIGAVELGEFAERLEKAGNENDTDTINEFIDELLTRYRALGRALAPLTQQPAEEGGEEDLPELSDEDIFEIFTAIDEFMSISDYDGAVQLIENLKGYRVPEKEKDRCKALIKAAADIRYEDITKILYEEN